MRIRIPFYILLLALISGCAAKPEITLSNEPVTIKLEELEKYWVQIKKNFEFKVLSSISLPKGVNGFVKIKYLIDSNGNTFNAEIVESEPKRVFKRVGLKALSKMKFEKSKSNPTAVPVYVTTVIKFNT